MPSKTARAPNLDPPESTSQTISRSAQPFQHSLLFCPGLPWIWNFAPISLSTDFTLISMDGYIYIHRCLYLLYTCIMTAAWGQELVSIPNLSRCSCPHPHPVPTVLVHIPIPMVQHFFNTTYKSSEECSLDICLFIQHQIQLVHSLQCTVLQPSPCLNTTPIVKYKINTAILAPVPTELLWIWSPTPECYCKVPITASNSG